MEFPSANTQALPAGTRIEEFMIERVLGSGGFGITYLARDVSLNRQVVIKENLPAQFAWRDTATGTIRPRHTHAGDADDYQWSMNNFLREAETLASLDHPGIVRVLRKFEANGTAYFVMPFVEGAALDELAQERQGKPFSEDELRGLLERVLSVLAYLHERGIYHRDIKPGNILISNEGVPALIDFGSARQRLSERSMTVIESAGYTPFEQLQSKGNVGPWSDLYALGATLEKILTGEAPPKAMDRMRNDPRVPLVSRADLKSFYSTAFLASIDTALAVEENQRWQNAGEWQATLRGESVTRPFATLPKYQTKPVSACPIEESEPEPDKKPNFIPWIVAACLVLGLIAVANLTGEKEASAATPVVDEAALQQERDRAEVAAAQARQAEQRAAQAEKEKETLIAQAKAKEEAEAREAERQRAAKAGQERRTLEAARLEAEARAEASKIQDEALEKQEIETQRVAKEQAERDAERQSATVIEHPSIAESPAEINIPSTGISKSRSGLISKILKTGSGTQHPRESDNVTVHYSGWTTDGKMFDSSVKRGQPASFPLNEVIKGWTEGVQLMVVGEKRRFWIPPDLAYGENPGGGRPGGMLVFEVELLGIKAAPKAPAVPKDVAGAPASAERTASGIASRVLVKGTGNFHPKATDQVKVRYSGWTTDGKLFDSSVVRGEAIVFPLNRVIPGWTEGVQLMVEGEKRRLWIPAKLAYGNSPPPGAPAGTLVFDVELLEIVRE